MDSSTSVAPVPRPSVFDVPELVEPIAHYLSRKDIVQCIVTCKAWAHIFEPFLWQDVVLSWLNPAPQTLARNRHRIRSLHITFTDYTNLRTLADDLPDIPSSGQDSSNPAPPNSLRESYSSTNPPATDNSLFPRLRTIYFYSDNEPYHDTDVHRSVCGNLVVRILHQSPGLTHLYFPGQFLKRYRIDQADSHDYIQNFMNVLAHGLPSLHRLEFRYHPVRTDIGLQLLRVCFNHPQLVNLDCNIQIGNKDSLTHDLPQFDALIKEMRDDKQAKEASGKLAGGSRIKELVLPISFHGYPPNFLCALLRSHLPNLERFEIPDIQRGGDASCRDPLREAVAQGCPKLQHLQCWWFEQENALSGIMEGCREWGLKSLYCQHLDDLIGYEGDYRFMKALVIDHYRTLEEVELVNCQSVHRDDFVSLFSMCRNLKRVEIQPGMWRESTMEFRDVVSREWVCHDLKKLHLILSESRNPRGTESESDGDDAHGDSGGNGGESGEDSDSDSHHQRSEDRRRQGREAFRQIGRLVRLEALCLDCDEYDDPECQYNLTLERGWLGELAGLKELKRLRMGADFWSRMGQTEVEFMHAQWPKLEMITFQTHLEQFLTSPHWQWLQERRPNLRYTSGSVQ